MRRYPDWPRLAVVPEDSERLSRLREPGPAIPPDAWREAVFTLFGLMERGAPRLADLVYDDLVALAHRVELTARRRIDWPHDTNTRQALPERRQAARTSPEGMSVHRRARSTRAS